MVFYRHFSVIIGNDTKTNLKLFEAEKEEFECKFVCELI